MHLNLQIYQLHSMKQIDSKSWKIYQLYFDSTHTWFASNPRNVRLALASDGFNLFWYDEYKL